MKTYDNLPPEAKKIIQEYGYWGIKALVNAEKNGVPLTRIEKELEQLRAKNRI